MRDIVITSQKIQKSINKELREMFGKNVPSKVKKVVDRELHKMVKSDIDVLLSNIDYRVSNIVQSRFSLDDVYPKKRGK